MGLLKLLSFIPQA